MSQTRTLVVDGLNPEPADPVQRLLVVDDDPSMVRLLSRLLTGMARIHFATSGEDALLQMRQNPPDLVLLDAEMPGLGGYETCRQIKADPALAHVPVIFVTAHTDTASETHALTIGAVDFIPKPLNPPVVQARVRTHLALKRQSDELRRLTATDALTGIANRRAFDDGLQLEWRRALRSHAPLSLLMVDVDYFKRFNDTYGHPAGDACLRAVARVLAGTARRAGDLVARYGGEEFALFLPATNASDAFRLGESLCQSVAALAIPHAASAVAAHVTVSVGVATLVLPCDGVEPPRAARHDCDQSARCLAAPQALLALADEALYAAKAAGRARVVNRVGTVGQGYDADSVIESGD